MNYRKPSRVVFLLVSFLLLAQLCAAALAPGAGRPKPGGAEVEAGVFGAGVIFGDRCARAGDAHAPAAVGRPSHE